MKKIISFMHVSLDGFVAGPKEEMDWIKFDQDLFDHVGQRIGQGNTSLYGRLTFQMMEAYWPTAAEQPNASKHDREHSSWYKNAHKIVLSKTLKEKDFSKTSILSDQVAERLTGLKQSTTIKGNEILLFGSPTATHALMELDLIDGYWLFVNPVILGKGIPLFAGIPHKTNLKLLNTKTFDCGVTELNYIVEK